MQYNMEDFDASTLMKVDLSLCSVTNLAEWMLLKSTGVISSKGQKESCKSWEEITVLWSFLSSLENALLGSIFGENFKLLVFLINFRFHRETG